MRDVNMEGITPNEYIAKALVQLRNFKQGALLERSLLTSKHVISEDIKNSYSDINIDELVRSQLMQKVAKHMINEFGDQITSDLINLFQLRQSIRFRQWYYRLLT